MKYLFVLALLLLTMSDGKAQKRMARSTTIHIDANADEVWQYVDDLSKWAEWAILSVQSVTADANGYWLMKGTQGLSKVKMHSGRAKGILDHELIDPQERLWQVACVVVYGDPGAKFTITYTKPEQVPAEDFETRMKLLNEELAELKKIMEHQYDFTLEQIKEAHSKVKSGADFPKYVQALKQMGVSHYSTYVSDGHTIYFGKNSYQVSSPAKYTELSMATASNKEQFVSDLKAHQQGKTDYPTFCNDCAKSGVEKWVVDISKMTCTYYDKKGNELLVEKIPEA